MILSLYQKIDNVRETVYQKVIPLDTKVSISI